MVLQLNLTHSPMFSFWWIQTNNFTYKRFTCLQAIVNFYTNSHCCISRFYKSFQSLILCKMLKESMVILVAQFLFVKTICSYIFVVRCERPELLLCVIDYIMWWYWSVTRGSDRNYFMWPWRQSIQGHSIWSFIQTIHVIC